MGNEHLHEWSSNSSSRRDDLHIPETTEEKKKSWPILNPHFPLEATPPPFLYTFDMTLS